MSVQGAKAIVRKLPMIKFRYVKTHHNQQAFGIQTHEKEAPSTKVTTSNAMDFYEMPSKYKRRPLTKEELECINNGGF